MYAKNYIIKYSVFIEHLICAEHASKYWEHSKEKNQVSALMELNIPHEGRQIINDYNTKQLTPLGASREQCLSHLCQPQCSECLIDKCLSNAWRSVLHT